ncbi:MAG: Fic family protein [Acidimicrobiales bacterium]
MTSFQREASLDPVPGGVVVLLRAIDRAAGSEARYYDQLPQLLEVLRDQARVESITASNAIEGVTVDESRVAALASGTPGRFRNRSEEEFAGYTAALDHLNQERPGELTVGLLLHLHRLLFSYTEGGGGQLKTDDSLVVNRYPDGSRGVRFAPVSARETPFFVSELVERTNAALASGAHHPLLITAAFALDLSCVHPFADGNGRVTRLATGFLLEQLGYSVGRYISLEQLIFESKGGYYEALGDSTVGWFDDGVHDVWPWARYLLDRLSMAYDRFETRVAAGTTIGTKQDRIRDFVLLHAPAEFTIADIRRSVPGVSDNTTRIVLGQLKQGGQVMSSGTGRGASWRRT